MKRVVRFINDGCARLLEVARGLHVQVSSCRDTSNRKGHFLGIIHSKMFGILTEKKKSMGVGLSGLWQAWNFLGLHTALDMTTLKNIVKSVFRAG